MESKGCTWNGSKFEFEEESLVLENFPEILSNKQSKVEPLALEADIFPTFKKALENFINSRIKEGETLVSNIRARAESLGIECSGGIAERSERLIITLTAYGLTGLSVNYAMSIGIWSVAILSIITILQRLMIVYKAVK